MKKNKTLKPQIRFKGYDDEWREFHLSDLGPVKMCKRIMKHQTAEKGDVPFFKIGTFGRCPDAYISKELFDEFQKLYPFPKKGDVLISAAGTIGRSVVYDGSPAYYQDSNIIWIELSIYRKDFTKRNAELYEQEHKNQSNP